MTTEYRILEKRRRLNRGGHMVVSSTLQYRTLDTVPDSDDHLVKMWSKWKSVPVQVAYLPDGDRSDG